jgi:hypothetical protein
MDDHRLAEVGPQPREVVAFTSDSSRDRRALTYATIVASEPARVISTTSVKRTVRAPRGAAWADASDLP